MRESRKKKKKKNVKTETTPCSMVWDDLTATTGVCNAEIFGFSSGFQLRVAKLLVFPLKTLSCLQKVNAQPLKFMFLLTLTFLFQTFMRFRARHQRSDSPTLKSQMIFVKS